MGKHILLDKAFIYPLPKSESNMSGCSFDAQAGYWKIDEDESPCILDSNRPRPQSKKADVETGEDRKGE
ncbi:MAG: hypothetical protein ACNYWU_13180 [Desulfobacterales bacterium]